jgi:hypothetical protein
LTIKLLVLGDLKRRAGLTTDQPLIRWHPFQMGALFISCIDDIRVCDGHGHRTATESNGSAHGSVTPACDDVATRATTEPVGTQTMTHNRFDYEGNVRRAGSYDGYRDAFWPPTDAVLVALLDVAVEGPDLCGSLRQDFRDLRDAIDAEWHHAWDGRHGHPSGLVEPAAVAAALRRIGAHLSRDADRRAALLRADAIDTGCHDGAHEALARLDEEVAVVAGQLATWHGKQRARMPTAFACRRDPAHRVVGEVIGTTDEAAAFLRGLHPDLRLRPVPAFAAARVFFMAGEGDRHPKHIAYFLPQDQGIAGSRHSKTYYFVNTHRALLRHQSTPLAARLLDTGRSFAPDEQRFDAVPTLGVLGHEFGHSVGRPGRTFGELDTADQWVSGVLQEVAADVFGILIATEVWADRVGVEPADVVTYYLAECLRYLSRGLGYFADSDGMCLQLNYLVALGALTIDKHVEGLRLVGEPDTVLAAVRSLGRVLADTLLDGNAAAAISIHDTFGPRCSDALWPIVEVMSKLPGGSVEYMQESHRPVAQFAS